MKDRKDFWVPWLISWGIIITPILIVNTLKYFLCDNPDCNHRFLVTKIVFQIFVLVTAIIYIICHFIDYANMNKADGESVRMKFNHFKDVYYINPDRWDMTPGHWRDNYGRLRYRSGEGYWRQETYYVTFSYFDWLKFLLWQKVDKYEKKIKRKRNEEEASNKRLADMLKYIQKDIDEAYEKIGSAKDEHR